MRADRLLSLLMLLQARGRMTAQELAQELEVSERTIYRDINALSASGVPVYAESGPGGGCALLDSYRTNLTGLTADETRALFMLSIPAPLG
jgi:predicted DNA-binding transcriptional regulator YafY